MIKHIASALAVMALLCLLPIIAKAHTITFDDGQTFTFDAGCCNANDCEQVPMSAITEVKGGYQIDYWTYLGAVHRRIRGFVPSDSTKIRFNPFVDRVMACSSYYSDPKEPNVSAPRCIYPVQPSM